MISELCLCKELRASAAACGRGKVQHIDGVCVNPRALGTYLPKGKTGAENKGSYNPKDKGEIQLPCLYPSQTPGYL